MAHSVLLTGGAGFIGSHTAVELLQAGYDVVIADDLSNCTEDVVTRIGRITGRTPAFHQVDVADRAALEEVFEQYDFEAVIHFAGFKAVGESVKEPLKYYRNNLDTTLTLLETMAYHHVNTIVFSSSATVYGVPETVPLTEDMPTGCTNPYGWTKYMIEQILRDQAAAHSGAEVFNLGTGHGYSVLDIVHAFEAANGVSVPYVIDPRRPGDIAECYAATEKAEKLLGWRAEKELEEMCRDAWRWETSLR